MGTMLLVLVPVGVPRRLSIMLLIVKGGGGWLSYIRLICFDGG
jgi:hypothetical protein